MLDYAALAALAAVIREGSFERAAQALFVTPSAVSQRIRSLEERVGCALVVRGQPCRATDTGRRLCQHVDRVRLLEQELQGALPALAPEGIARVALPIAVNADSLATWVLPALDEVVRDGQREGYGLELVVDDQDFTHDWLREGSVLGCVSTVAEALRGCTVERLGAMRYIAVASPAFCERHLAQGLNRTNFAHLPWLVFNRKDDAHTVWVGRAFGLRDPRLKERSVPSSEAHVRAAIMGWGIGVMSEQIAAPYLSSGVLQALHPDVHIDVLLHWHQWKLRTEDTPEPVLRAGALDRVGRALIVGGRLALRPAPG